ncbi:MAG: T9SS type A sorting domain-containing protein [Dysgonamonadaceae bacterium]|nr:T9SS type A sorting domain-containing protein [Dysgonamonadaceae bacterium]
MYSYNSGEETLDVSFEDGIATDIQLITTSKTKLSHTVQLYNFTGNLIKEGRSVGETVTWNLSSLPRGIYIISVKDRNNEIYNRKFFKN